jgi:hypothetical protein
MGVPTWLSTDSIGSVFVGDLDTRHVSSICVQPNCTVVFSANTGIWWLIGSLEADTSIVGAAKCTA